MPPPPPGSITPPSSRSSSVCSAWPGATSAPARAPICGPLSQAFCEEQSHWLDDYALFRALKTRFEGAAYLDWPAELVRREPAALEAARRELAAPCEETRFAQFLLSRQGGRLKEYARSRGLRLLGDLPFYVSPDSSDVWAAPQLFRLDEHRRPLFVAGVPPDYFSATGQFWGNPVYDWQALQRGGYRWWIERLRALLAHVDMVRLDHFRGFRRGLARTCRVGDGGDRQMGARPRRRFLCRRAGGAG